MNFNFSGPRLFGLIVFNLGVGSSMQYIPNSFLLFIAAVVGNIAIVNVQFNKKKAEEFVQQIDLIKVNLSSDKEQKEKAI